MPVSSSRAPRTWSFAALVVGALVSLSACGGSGSSSKDEQTVEASPSATGSTASAPAGTTIAITLSGGTVSPDGKRVPVKKNTPIVLKIDADKAGELHVHSSPEKHVDFPKGSSTTTLKFDKPGVIEVEDHSLDKLIVQLEVR